MISRLVYVSCDRCLAACGGDEGLKLDAVEARRFAKRNGWTRVSVDAGLRHEDVCPQCRRPDDRVTR